jgi:hypothetical protein
MRIPTLTIADSGIDGGVFDHGVTGESVLHSDLSDSDWFKAQSFAQPFQNWADKVRKLHQGEKDG